MSLYKFNDTNYRTTVLFNENNMENMVKTVNLYSSKYCYLYQILETYLIYYKNRIICPKNKTYAYLYV